jgi:hypothetical protein
MKSQINKTLNFIYNSPQIIIIIYTILGLIGILNHAMWRDEMNAWLIVRDANSFSELMANIHYDRGHPGLWHFLLAILKNLVNNPIIMQLFHWILAVIILILFWQFSPFTHLQKFLFSFGFFPFYEYLLISRNYSLGILFLFAFCTLFNTRKQTYLILALLLGLMANTNIYIFFISAALGLMLTLELFFDVKQRQIYLNKNKLYDLLLSLIIVIICYSFAIYIITPPPDAPPDILGEYILGFDLPYLFKAIGKIFSGYTLIIPNSKRILDLTVCAIIGIFIIIINLCKLWEKPLPLVFYLFAHLEILIFTYFKYMNSSFRHFGHCYFIMLAAIWLANFYQETKPLISFNWIKIGKKWHKKLFITILFVQLLGGIYGYPRDLIIPFSAAKETANYIKNNQLDQEFIVASRDVNMASISGYLNRKLYYPELQDMGGAFLFLKPGRNDVDHSEVLRQVNSIFQTQENLTQIILILHQELTINEPELNITHLKTFDNSFTSDEVYYLYQINRLN